MGMVVWLWRGRAGYGGIWGDTDGREEVMLPMTCFGVWGLSLSMATITTSVGFKVILRRTERLRWATWATMGGLAHEHIGHRARSPFGHRDGVPPVCPYCLSARLPVCLWCLWLRVCVLKPTAAVSRPISIVDARNWASTTSRGR